MQSDTRLLIVAGTLIGVLAGLGAYTFVYARGYSYLTNDPEACANCHIMRDHFAAWTRSSHRAVATCNDCHTPPGLIGKYATKAQNGFWHSFYFTTGRYPDPLFITSRNQAVTEQACRGCHGELTESIEPMRASVTSGAAVAPRHGPQTSCIRCHSTVGHIE
jgi:cytochrome c nitrite reductase small subunit